jgi:hypothetical protein
MSACGCALPAVVPMSGDSDPLYCGRGPLVSGITGCGAGLASRECLEMSLGRPPRQAQGHVDTQLGCLLRLFAAKQQGAMQHTAPGCSQAEPTLSMTVASRYIMRLRDHTSACFLQFFLTTKWQAVTVTTDGRDPCYAAEGLAPPWSAPFWMLRAFERRGKGALHRSAQTQHAQFSAQLCSSLLAVHRAKTRWSQVPPPRRKYGYRDPGLAENYLRV